jgi:hypothetical protein
MGKAEIAQSVIVLGYKLEGNGIGVRFPAEARKFFFSISSRSALRPPSLLSYGYRDKVARA